MPFPCGANCTHGGCCILDEGHEGLHDTTYCQWTDEESLSDVEADAILLANHPEWAPLVDLQRTIEGLGRGNNQ